MPAKRKSRLCARPWLKKKLLLRLETPEKRALRLEKNRKRAADRRAHETEEEREVRLARSREAARSRRASAKYSARRAQQMIAPLGENCRRRKSKEVAARQTMAMVQEINSVTFKPIRTRGKRKQKVSEESNECGRYKNTSSVFFNGSCVPQNHPLNIMYDQQHLAYGELLGHTFLQSQLQQNYVRMWPKTPEQMLQLGLVACPADIMHRSLVERTPANSDESENDLSLGVECEVTIEEGEELKEKKLFKEERPFDEVEFHELPKCGHSLVEYRSSTEQESLACKEDNFANVKKLKEEIPQPSNSQRSTEILRDECTPEEIPQPSNSQRSTEILRDECTPEEIPQPSNSQRSTEILRDECTPEEIPQPSNSQRSTEILRDECTPEEIPQPSNSQRSTEILRD